MTDFILLVISHFNQDTSSLGWKATKYLGLVKSRVEAVSYTHLDVYKRQMKNYASYIKTMI